MSGRVRVLTKGAAICNLPNKEFFVIELYILDQESNFIVGPLQAVKFKTHARVKFISDYQLFSVVGDFTTNLGCEIFKDSIAKLTNDVEEMCPVSNEFGIKGVGEGIVWTSICGKHRFKAKGSKHSTVDKKPAPPKDLNLEFRKEELFNSVVTQARLEQAISEVNQGEFTTKVLGELIKWVVNDVIKEDLDVIEEFGFDAKSWSKFGAQKAAKKFKELYDE